MNDAETLGANPEVNLLAAIVKELITSKKLHKAKTTSGGLVHKATKGINFHKIGEALLGCKFDRPLIVSGCTKAYADAGWGKLNPGVFGRLGKTGDPKTAKPSYKGVLASIKGNIKKVKAIKDTKANAEEKAALLLEVKALQGLLV